MSKLQLYAALLMFAATNGSAASVASPLKLLVLGSGGRVRQGELGQGTSC
jgi:hypothetical protein